MELLIPVDFYHDSKSGLKPICMPSNPDYNYNMMGKSDWAGMASFGFVGEDPDIIKYPDSDAFKGWPSSLREISTQIWPQAFCKVVLNNAKTYSENLFWRKSEDGLGDVFNEHVIGHEPLCTSVAVEDQNNQMHFQKNSRGPCKADWGTPLMVKENTANFGLR